MNDKLNSQWKVIHNIYKTPPDSTTKCLEKMRSGEEFYGHWDVKTSDRRNFIDEITEELLDCFNYCTMAYLEEYNRREEKYSLGELGNLLRLLNEVLSQVNKMNEKT